MAFISVLLLATVFQNKLQRSKNYFFFFTTTIKIVWLKSSICLKVFLVSDESIANICCHFYGKSC